MTLAVNLSASFTSGGFDLQGTVGGLGSVMAAASPVPVSFDVSSTSSITDLLAHADTGAIASLIGPLVEHISDVVPGFPDIGPLFGPLHSALSVFELATSGDLEALRQRVDDAGLPALGTDIGLPALQASIKGLSALASDPTVHGVLDLVRPALPSFDLGAPGALLGGPAGGLVSLIQLIAGLMAVETASREFERMAALVEAMLHTDRINGLLATLRTTTGPGLAQLLTGVDPDSVAVVDAVTAPVVSYVDNVRTVADLLVRGLAFGEATLVHADFTALAARLEAGTLLLSESALPPVGLLATTASGWLAPIVGLSLPAAGPAGVVQAEIATMAASMSSAIAAVDPGVISRPLSHGLDTVLGPIRAIEHVALQVVAAIRSAFQQVQTALDAVDLSSLQAAFNTVLGPVSQAIDGISSLIGGAQSAIQTAASATLGVIDPVQTALDSARDTIHTAFASLASAIEALGLADLSTSLRQGVGTVADALHAAQVGPVFDVAAGAINTGASLLGAVPKALLPDDVRQELDAACAPLEALDLEPLRTEMHAELAGIVASIDTTVLHDLDVAFQAVVAFLDSIDPEPLLRDLEAGAFSAMVNLLRQADPTTILAPITAALDQVKAAVAAFDPASALKPIDQALDEVKHALDAVDATALLGPVEVQIEDFRHWVDDVLGLSTWSERLAAVDSFVAQSLARLDPDAVLIALAQAWSTVVAQVRGEPANAGAGAMSGASVLGTLVAGLVEGLGLGVHADSFDEVLAWIAGERDGSAVVRERVRRAAAALDRTQQAVAAIDIQTVVADLEATNRSVLNAITAYPDGSLLRLQLERPVTLASPLASLGSTLTARDRYLSELGTASSLVALLAPSDRGEVQAIADGLRTNLVPLRVVPVKLRQLLAVFGLDATGLTLREALARLLEQLSPDELQPLVAVFTAAAAKVGALVHDGVVAPLQAGIATLTGALDAVDISFIGEEITSIHDALEQKLDQLRPATILAPVLSAFDQAKQSLAAFDPFGPVRAVIDGLKAAITHVAEDLRPTVLMKPILDVFHEVRNALGSLDVGDILTPVLDALDGIARQLDDGMDKVIAALGHLKQACESDGGIIGAIGAVVSVGISF